MIAYFILAHRYPHQFKRLFKSIYHADNHYLIHIDKGAEAETVDDITLFLNDYDNAS
ncbi:beta-1,6-N-acetylglucosaminyltransferase, partial [Erwinia billingiae]|uniref:beta-1,6-N-acetylglucosaminyltransferase n=1 Tax=Erwinia billingiae TaxID=182337 RepID=UPI001F5F442A